MNLREKEEALASTRNYLIDLIEIAAQERDWDNLDNYYVALNKVMLAEESLAPKISKEEKLAEDLENDPRVKAAMVDHLIKEMKGCCGGDCSCKS